MAVATALRAAGADVNLPAANAAAGFGGAAGLTPLMAAATVGSFELLAWLLAHGASVNVADAVGKTALHIAAVAGARWEGERRGERGLNVQMVEALVGAGPGHLFTASLSLVPRPSVARGRRGRQRRGQRGSDSHRQGVPTSTVASL